MYVAEFYTDSNQDRNPKEVYFTSRFELGNDSVYEKLRRADKILKTSSIQNLFIKDKELQRELEEEKKDDGQGY